MKHLLVSFLVLFAVGCGVQGTPEDNTDDGVAATGGSAPQGTECPAVCPAGAQGLPGSSGTSCSVVQGEAGATISCGDGTSAVVPAGADGKDGVDGVAQVGPMGPAGPAGASIVGPQGPAGASIVGPAGPQGAPGKDGIVDTGKLYKVTNSVNVGSSTSYSVVAACDAGDFVLTGGCTHGSDGTTVGRLKGSAPSGSTGTESVPTQWNCTFGGGSFTGFVYAFCMDVTP